MAPPHTVPLAGRAGLWALVIRHARCSDGRLDPDQWFPVSADPGRARQEAAAAIAVCTTCPVRGHCLTLSLRHWDTGQHGVWGGLVAADRARLRRRVAMDAGLRPATGDGQVPSLASPRERTIASTSRTWVPARSELGISAISSTCRTSAPSSSSVARPSTSTE
jgi:hypothetical protein